MHELQGYLNFLQCSVHKPGSEYDIRACVALHQACEMRKIFNFWRIFHDQTQEHNSKECEDRIRVYPSIALHCTCNERQCEGDTMQCKPLCHIVNWALHCNINFIHDMSPSPHPVCFNISIPRLHTLV